MYHSLLMSDVLCVFITILPRIVSSLPIDVLFLLCLCLLCLCLARLMLALLMLLCLCLLCLCLLCSMLALLMLALLMLARLMLARPPLTTDGLSAYNTAYVFFHFIKRISLVFCRQHPYHFALVPRHPSHF